MFELNFLPQPRGRDSSGISAFTFRAYGRGKLYQNYAYNIPPIIRLYGERNIFQRIIILVIPVGSLTLTRIRTELRYYTGYNRSSSKHHTNRNVGNDGSQDTNIWASG